MDDEIWLQRDGESSRAFDAFRCYLETKPRTFANVAAKCGHKSDTQIRRWAHRYDWKPRAQEYDRSLLQSARQLIAQELTERIIGQWQACGELQTKSLDALLSKDMSRASFKALNETFFNACELQARLLDFLGVDGKGDAADKGVTEIKIIGASRARDD